MLSNPSASKQRDQPMTWQPISIGGKQETLVCLGAHENKGSADMGLLYSRSASLGLGQKTDRNLLCAWITRHEEGCKPGRKGRKQSTQLCAQGGQRFNHATLHIVRDSG